MHCRLVMQWSESLLSKETIQTEKDRTNYHHIPTIFSVISSSSVYYAPKGLGINITQRRTSCLNTEQAFVKYCPHIEFVIQQNPFKLKVRGAWAPQSVK